MRQSLLTFVLAVAIASAVSFTIGQASQPEPASAYVDPILKQMKLLNASVGKSDFRSTLRSEIRDGFGKLDGDLQRICRNTSTNPSTVGCD